MIDVVDESGGAAVDVDDLVSLSRHVLVRQRLHERTEMTVRLVDEDTITALNARWMGGTGATDVLAFPMDELRAGTDQAPAQPGYLGDLALCPQVADRQVGTGEHARRDELRLLTVHGILHLLGHDHAEPAEHEAMFAVQADLLGSYAGDRA